MRRRHFIAALGAATLAPAFASAAVTRMPLSQAFRFLDSYLTLTPAQHSLFHIAYRATQNDRPAPSLKASIVDAGGQRRPLALNASGEVTELPSLAELKSSAAVESDTPFRLGIELSPDLAAATRLDAAALDQALAQANAAIAHLAGMLAAVAPKLDITLFLDAGGGASLSADGRSAPLPIVSSIKQIGPTPYLRSADAGARWVTLARAPSRILFAKLP